jgi:hypothetical protein
MKTMTDRLTTMIAVCNPFRKISSLLIHKHWQCFISDSILAWRFYVVYGARQRWALYLPAVAVISNSCEDLF